MKSLGIGLNVGESPPIFSYKPFINYKWSSYTDENGNRFLKDFGKSHSDGKLMFGKAVKPNDVDQSFDINCIGATTLYVFKDGVLVSEDVSTIDTYTASENVAYSNAITTSQAFTDAQVEYQYKYPEKFLYHEKTVNADGSATWTAKSKILNQDELDNVVAHLPMCETDFYVRDMVGYGEFPVEGRVDDAPTNDDEETTYEVVSDTSYNLAVTTAGTNIVRPYLAHPFISNSAETITLVEFDVVVNSGTPILQKMYNGTYSETFAEELKTGHYKFNIGTGNGDYGYIVQYFDGTKEFDIEVTNFKVYSTTGNTQITNPTSDMLLTNQTNGLQTCFLERDELGVVVGGSFDRLSCDGGVVSTNFIPDVISDTYYEFVVECNDTDTGGIFAGVPYNSNSRLEFGLKNNSDGMICRYGSKATYPDEVYTPNAYNHIIFKTTSDATLDIFANGEYIQTLDSSDAIDNSDGILTLGARSISESIGVYSFNHRISLSKIHTTPQDPLKLYQDAQIAMAKKGITI